MLTEAALGFYGKWLDEKKDAQARADKLAEEARRKTEEAKDVAKKCGKQEKFAFYIYIYHSSSSLLA